MPALEAAHLGSKAAMVVKVTSAMQAKGAAVASSAMQAKGAAVASQVIFEEVPSATLATWSFPPLWPLGHFHHFGHLVISTTLATAALDTTAIAITTATIITTTTDA